MPDNDGMQGGQGWQGDKGNNNEQDRQDQQNKQDEQNNQRMLKDIQRGARDIERQLKQFESMIVKFVKKGVVISEEIKTKISDLKGLVEKYKAITTVEDVAGIDTQEMWDKMRELEEESLIAVRYGNKNHAEYRYLQEWERENYIPTSHRENEYSNNCWKNKEVVKEQKYKIEYRFNEAAGAMEEIKVYA